MMMADSWLKGVATIMRDMNVKSFKREEGGRI
jgi:hypothetical protein